MRHGSEEMDSFLTARGEATRLLEAAEETFDLIAVGVEMLIVAALVELISFRWVDY